MNKLFTLSSNVYNTFWPQAQSVNKNLFLILAGVFLLAAASQLSIPFEPVPLTFQSTTVVLIGMLYGARYGAYVILTYFLAGALGLPVFADFSSGISNFLGPTGGYLAGFLPAAYLSGYLAHKGHAKTVLGSFIVACLGTSVLFLLGLSWLATFFGWQQAMVMGLFPFLLSEPTKLIAVAVIVPKVWKQFPTCKD